MGLDKWIKPDEKKTKAIKKKDEGEQVKENGPKPKGRQIEKDTLKITKFNLTCSNAKCKYIKTIVKNKLTEKDKVCPRCKKEMKIK